MQKEEAKNPVNNIKIPYVSKGCIWCWACLSISPDAFEFSEDWLSQAIMLENYEWKNVEDSIAACPVNAISWR